LGRRSLRPPPPEAAQRLVLGPRASTRSRGAPARARPLRARLPHGLRSGYQRVRRRVPRQRSLGRGRSTARTRARAPGLTRGDVNPHALLLALLSALLFASATICSERSGTRRRARRGRVGADGGG